jgi:integrative and conjugative element protein (TIGR02256 family)
MKLILPVPLLKRLKTELRRAGTREIGGVLVGEHIGQDVFRIADLSVQRSGGSAAHFVRDPRLNRAFLDEFFARTGMDYKRFNYLGEWHSHPSFSPIPSGPDIATMMEIVQDREVGANFVVLLIASLRWPWSLLEVSATAFQPHTPPVGVTIELESAPKEAENWLLRTVTRLFGGKGSNT